VTTTEPLRRRTPSRSSSSKAALLDPRRRLQLIIGAVAAGAVVSGTAVITVLTTGGHQVATTTPIHLPDRVLGLAVQQTPDPLHGGTWNSQARAAVGTAALAARLYTTPSGPANRRTVRLVAARADLTGKLEQAWATNAGDAVGADRCTHDVQVAAHTRAAVRPTVLLCWRTSSSLSAYSLIIDPEAKAPVSNADGAAALDAAWKAAGGTD
jgi:hypothetical protein